LLQQKVKETIKSLTDFFPSQFLNLILKGNILFPQSSGKEFFGIECPENQYKDCQHLDYMDKEDVPRVIENIKKSNQAVLFQPNEYTVKRPDGTLCPVLILALQ
jgi:hypothetical protein